MCVCVRMHVACMERVGFSVKGSVVVKHSPVCPEDG